MPLCTASTSTGNPCGVIITIHLLTLLLLFAHQDRMVRSKTQEFALIAGPPVAAAVEGPSAAAGAATVSNGAGAAHRCAGRAALCRWAGRCSSTCLSSSALLPPPQERHGSKTWEVLLTSLRKFA